MRSSNHERWRLIHQHSGAFPPFPPSNQSMIVSPKEGPPRLSSQSRPGCMPLVSRRMSKPPNTNASGNERDFVSPDPSLDLEVTEDSMG